MLIERSPFSLGSILICEKMEEETSPFLSFITHSLKPAFLLNALVSLFFFCNVERNCKEQGINYVSGVEKKSRNSQKFMV